MPIRVTGLRATVRAVSKAKEKVKKSLKDGLVTAANTILNASQKLVPVDTGALKSTGRVEVEEKSGLGVNAKVVYGGNPPVIVDLPGFLGTELVPNAIQKVVDYAFVVHERLEIYHEPPTQARFLADAVAKVRGNITNALKRDVRAGTEGF